MALHKHSRISATPTVHRLTCYQADCIKLILSATRLEHETEQNSEICCFARSFGSRVMLAQSAKGASIMTLQEFATDRLYSVRHQNVFFFDSGLFRRHRVTSFITVNETIGARVFESSLLSQA